MLDLYEIKTNHMKLSRFILIGLLIAKSGTTFSMLGQDINQGFAYLCEKKYKDAESFFTGLQDSENHYIKNFGNLGMAKIALIENRFEDAKKLLDLLGKTSETLIPLELKHEWMLDQAHLALKFGEWNKCHKWLGKIKNPSNSIKRKSLLLLSNLYLKQAQSIDNPIQRKNSLACVADCMEMINLLFPTNQYFLEYAKFLIAKSELLNDKNSLLEAVSFFDKAGREFDKNKCELLIQEGSETSLKQAAALIEKIPLDPEKILLHAKLLSNLRESDQAVELLKTCNLPEPFQEKQIFLLGSLFYEKKQYSDAISQYQILLNKYPSSSLIPETLYWTARAKEANGESSKEYRMDYQKLYQQFPKHPLADEAYFYSYSPQDYLMGDKIALKHLNAFSNQFPNSPLLLHAFYYIGLDQLHDRRSPEGKWISRQNLMGAIESFQKVESFYNFLNKTKDVSHFALLRDQAILERAKTNLKIANLSKPAKKAIYLDYAEEVFKTLKDSFDLEKGTPIFEETLYFLALTQMQSGKTDEAIRTWDLLIKGSDNIKNPYYAALAFYHKGQLKAGEEAIALFDLALEKGYSLLSNDETLSIMIAKSDEYRKINQLDKAMLQLSDVVNSNMISSLRLKAMYLRAEIYEEQGRKNLAQKQLESIALKGGEWALKAKDKLDKYYGYE